jgi:gluconate 5-dehydrogenase
MRINKPPQETSLEEWKQVIDTNITGTFVCCREAGKVMIPQKRGKIVNISSMSGSIVNKYFHGGSYEVSKCALNMLTKVLAVEWAPYNITVNSVAPGYYDTQPNRDFFSKETGLYQKVLDMIPVEKLGDLDELSRLILHLVSAPGNYLTGETITIDGGYTLW